VKDRIYIKHWLELKPQNYSSNTDSYYLKIANKIYSSFNSESKLVLLNFMDKEEIYSFCCFLTCYFEDIISDTNLWQSFKKEYTSNHNKTLPFFNLDSNYIDEEINVEDLAILIWYFINTIQEDKFANPYNEFIWLLANQAMLVLDEEYEFAPENKVLQKFYQLHPEIGDFYDIRHVIHNIFFQSYLFYPDIKQKLNSDISQILEDKKDEDPGLLMEYIKEIIEDYTFNRSSSLLSLNGKDWVKSVLGKSHNKHESISSISNKIKGLFIYKKQDEYSVFLEHIASSMLFELTKKSFDHYNDLKEDDIIYIGLVNFNNEWWFSGSFHEIDFDADLMLDQKNSAKDRAAVNFLMDSNEIKDILKKQEDAFLGFNANSLIAFMKSEDLNSFLDDYTLFFNNSLQLSEQQNKEAHERTRTDGYFGNDSDYNISDDEIIVFFNPKCGIEIFQNISNAFPDKRNPFFTEESHEDVQHILMSEECSTEFAHYLIENYKDKLSYFKKEPYKSYLNDLDFLLKFWKKENYNTKNSLVLIGKK